MSETENKRVLLVNMFTRVLRERTGLHEKFSFDIATDVVDGLAEEYGCENLYIPALPKEKRRDAVLADFDGTNRDAVCRRHGISKSTFYRYLDGAS